MSKRNLVCGSYLVALAAVLGLMFGVSKTRASSDHRHHSMNMSGRHDWPVKDCSDLRMRFDDREAVLRSEEKTLTKSEVSVLQVRPHRNGGVQVMGWDKDSYSVTACKAARADGDAEKILSEIHLVVDGSKVSATGPSYEDGWTVYLLVNAPKSASLDVETENGPVGIYDLAGKLTAHAHNGPISLRNFSGDADVKAVNGPISLEGSSGNVRVHTENGPISVDLAGTSWSGAGLSADAQNGPVTLHVPSGYQSSFLMESEGHSPMSCRASICGEARKTWDDDHKRIEFGTGPAVIRLSTVNGPMAVE
jgi:DUF4097 and DUF4098 domain-containing protein YvlB